MMAIKRGVPADENDSDDSIVQDVSRKKSKTTNQSTGPSENQVDEEGNTFWEISRLRRVQISDFKGNTFVGIREFYEKDGKHLPGKKGISLSIEQFNSVIQLLPQIELALKDKGIDVPRPKYGISQPVGTTDDTASGRASKANHEATSDEDEDDDD